MLFLLEITNYITLSTFCKFKIAFEIHVKLFLFLSLFSLQLKSKLYMTFHVYFVLIKKSTQIPEVFKVNRIEIFEFQIMLNKVAKKFKNRIYDSVC